MTMDFGLACMDEHIHESILGLWDNKHSRMV
jgi:hypothetical protein